MQKQKVLKEQLSVSKDIISLNQKEFKLGKKGFMDLISSKDEFFSIKKKLLAVNYDIILAKYKLLFLSGSLKGNLNR